MKIDFNENNSYDFYSFNFCMRSKLKHDEGQYTFKNDTLRLISSIKDSFKRYIKPNTEILANRFSDEGKIVVIIE